MTCLQWSSLCSGKQQKGTSSHLFFAEYKTPCHVYTCVAALSWSSQKFVQSWKKIWCSAIKEWWKTACGFEVVDQIISWLNRFFWRWYCNTHAICIYLFIYCKSIIDPFDWQISWCKSNPWLLQNHKVISCSFSYCFYNRLSCNSNGIWNKLEDRQEKNWALLKSIKDVKRIERTVNNGLRLYSI